MFCPNCGTNLPEGSAFCPNCGYDIQKGAPAPAQPWQPNPQQYAPPPYGYNLPLKSELLAVILSFFIPGAGQMYVGKFMRGLLILASYIALSAISVWFVFSQIGDLTSTSDADAIMSALSGSLWLIATLSIVTFVIWIVQLVDVYLLTQKYNEGLRRTGQAPW